MKIGMVELENFMLYKKFKRNFSDKDVVGIVAEYANNENKSNKGGKSTLVEAVRWVLFGDSRADFDVELIHRGANHMFGQVTLVDGKLKTKIKRGVDAKGHTILEVNGIEKKREAQAEINKLIGYTSDEFALTTFYKQGDINQFMELKPAQKKEYLMRWLKNNHWTALERMVLDDASAKEKRLEDLRSQRKALEERVEGSVEGFQKQIIASLRQVKKLKKKAKILYHKMAFIKAAKANGEKARDELEEVEIQIANAEENIEAAPSAEYIAALKANVKKFEKRANKKLDLGHTEAQLRQQEAGYRQRANDLVKKLAGAESLTGTCPILQEPCDRICAEKGQVAKWTAQRKVALEDAATVQEKIDALDARRRAKDKLREAQKTLEAAESNVRENAAGMAALEALKKRREALDEKVAAAHLDRVEAEEVELEEKNQELSAAIEELGHWKERLKSFQKNQKAIEELSAKILKLEKGVLPRLRYLAFMFGKNGIPSQEIENAFDEIEDDINLVLRKLGTALEVSFTPDREIGAWEDYCIECGWQFPKGTRTKECEECGAERRKKRKDELQLRVQEDGHDSGFHMESGGGKTLVSIATRVALTRLLQRQTGSTFNSIFLDEPDSAFDPVNRANFVKLITTTLKDLGFEQTFWITHSKEYSEQVPHLLKIKRYKNHSEASWA